jgi:hypothetical protein
MIYFSLGLPGHLSRWCDLVIRRMALQPGKPVSALEIDDSTGEFPVLDRAALNLIETGATHLVIGTRKLDGELKDILTEFNAPFVLALDDPRAAVAFLGETAGPANLQDATRSVANACPVVMELAALPGCLIIRRPASTMLKIARHLGIACSPKRAIKLTALFEKKRRNLPEPNFEKAWEGVERKMVEGALAPYAAHFRREPMGDITWTREFFTFAGDTARGLDQPVDLSDTGNGKFLVYGPYLRLPPGYWSAQIVLGVSPEAAGQTLNIDAFSGTKLAATTLSPRLGGVYTASLDFAVDDATSQDLEIRIMVKRDSAPGQFAFGHVVLHPITLHQGDIAESENYDFLSALKL